MSHRLSHRLSTTLSSLGSTSGLRTLDDVRDQVATELAMRAASTAETVDGVRLGVVLTLASADDERFLRLLAESLRDRLLHTSHLFALATTGAEAHLLFTGSSPAQVQRALSVAAATLTGRMGASSTAADERSAQAAVEGVSLMDEPLLWRVLRASLVSEEIALAERSEAPRLTPRETLDAVHGRPHGDSLALSAPPADFTLDDVRAQVARELARRALATAEIIDGARLGVLLTLSHTDDAAFLRRVAYALAQQFLGIPHLFALATTGADAHLLLTGAPPAHVQRALLLTTAAFPLRVRATAAAPDGTSFEAAVQDITPADEPVLWRALRQSLARDERTPPPGALGVAQMLAGARRGVRRLTPGEAFDAVQGLGDPALLSGGPTFLVDIRPAPRRGGITGSLVVDRNDLEWAFDPRLAVPFAVPPSQTSSSSSSSSSPTPLLVHGSASGRAAPLPASPPSPPPPSPAPETELDAALRAEAEAEAEARAQHLLIASSYALRPILICADGRASSLAAAALRALGLYNATDVVGGFRAWREAGLDVAGGDSTAEEEY